MTETVTYRIGTYYGEPGDLHIWEITDKHGVAAELYVDLSRHEVMSIDVRRDRRRQGLARQLWQTATAQMPVYHAPAAHRTEEGHLFAVAVGGEALDYDCDCAACTYEEE